MLSSRSKIEPPAQVSDLDAARLRLELAVDAAAIGGFDWDLATNTLVWDERLKMLLGVDRAYQPSVAGFVRRMLPADRPSVELAFNEALRSCGDLRVDYRIIAEAGATRWLTTRGRVLCNGAGQAVRVVGAVFDSSSVHTDREQAARALDTMATAYATVDTDWSVRYANEAARALVAGRGEPVGTPVWELVPGLAHPSIARLLRGVMAGGDPATVEVRAERPGGWIEVSVQPVTNGVAILVTDVTARREAQNEAGRAAARLALLARAGNALVQRRPVAETVETGLGLLVPQLARLAMIYLREGTGQRLSLAGLRHEDPTAQAGAHRPFESLPPGGDPATATASATATGVLAVPLVSRGDTLGFVRLLGVGGQTPTGEDLVLIEDIVSRIASAIDNAQILGQVQQARRTAEQVTARLEFLASIADALGSTLDAEQASVRLARMLVPTLADWSMVTLLDDDGRVEDIASSHSDPAKQDLLDRYTKRRRESLASDGAMLREAVSMDQPLFQLDGDAFAGRLRGDAAQEELAALDPGVVTALPILARDRTLGVISCYNSRERGFPTDEEMDAAREVARRAGLVLDNARLYARSQSMAETLQRSLLTPAVKPADLHVVTRYVPALADAQVGGDWYDAFQTSDGITTLVIGDVMGHDTDAAALMGQLRTLVRAIAVDRQEPPGAVLRRVDAAAEALGVDTTATAVLAQVLKGTTGDGSRQLRWSNAGHPPPMLLAHDGTVRVLDTAPDLLLGLGGGFARADHLAELPNRSTVLMFTDGLVEGRAQPLDIGMRRLALIAAPLAALPLDELCDQLLGALLPPQGAEDDVALVALRVQPGA